MVVEEVGEVSTSKDTKQEESFHGFEDKVAIFAALKRLGLQTEIKKLEQWIKEVEEDKSDGEKERWCEEGAVVEEVTEEVGEVSTSKDIKEEESLRDGSETAGDQEAKLDKLFANLKNEEEGASGVGSSVEALEVKLDQHLKKMEEIAKKGRDEYQGMLEKVEEILRDGSKTAGDREAEPTVCQSEE